MALRFGSGCWVLRRVTITRLIFISVLRNVIVIVIAVISIVVFFISIEFICLVIFSIVFFSSIVFIGLIIFIVSRFFFIIIFGIIIFSFLFGTFFGSFLGIPFLPGHVIHAMAQSLQHRLRHQISKILDFLGMGEGRKRKQN